MGLLLNCDGTGQRRGDLRHLRTRLRSPSGRSEVLAQAFRDGKIRIQFMILGRIILLHSLDPSDLYASSLEKAASFVAEIQNRILREVAWELVPNEYLNPPRPHTQTIYVC